MEDVITADSAKQTGEKHTLGNEAEVNFIAFNKTIHGKVDTGATTSSLHAERISVSRDGSKVSFISPSLSNNVITLEIDSQQEVHSADGGGNQRPVVQMEIVIDGVHLGPMQFNLNDRGDMDNELLIGQNILRAGNFVVDVQQDGGDPEGSPDLDSAVVKKQKIGEAIRILRDANITLEEMMVYIQTEAISKLQV